MVKDRVVERALLSPVLRVIDARMSLFAYSSALGATASGR